MIHLAALIVSTVIVFGTACFVGEILWAMIDEWLLARLAQRFKVSKGMVAVNLMCWTFMFCLAGWLAVHGPDLHH